VLDEIETAIVLVASSVLRGEGFSYTLPNRSKGNQLYVPGARLCCAACRRAAGAAAWQPCGVDGCTRQCKSVGGY
jgi:hypothetical protein